MNAALLTATNLEVRYGHSLAVRGVSLLVRAGEVTTVIGANGAGKTSLLAGLVGLERRSGSIQFDGHDIGRSTPEDNARRGLILVPEQRELFGSMSVLDNLVLGGALGRAIPRHSIRDGLDSVFARFPRLRERRAQLAGTLSGGERQMLALGRALMGRPKLLLLDEPSLGLAPNIVREMFAWIVGLRDEGTSILLVEQNAHMALAVAQQAYVMDGGLFSVADTADRVAARGDIAARFLGHARSAQGEPR
jgi:branched-chain amino acid transport system ATP-binding protein